MYRLSAFFNRGLKDSEIIFLEKQFGCYLCLRIYSFNKNDTFFPFLTLRDFQIAYKNKKGPLMEPFL